MTMTDDIKKYPIYFLTVTGELESCEWIKTTADYNHYDYNLHHYIPKSQYDKNEQWYADRGIEQKLILLPVWLHELVHGEVKQISDKEFKKRFRISRWQLVFNRKYSKY